MEVYVFTVENINPKKDKFGNNRRARVYKIEKNIPKNVGDVDYKWGLSQGDESEVFKAIMNWGYIPKELYNVSECDWRGPGYYCHAIEDKGYKIIRLY